jgi:hypothetical protein
MLFTMGQLAAHKRLLHAIIFSVSANLEWILRVFTRTRPTHEHGSRLNRSLLADVT